MVNIVKDLLPAIDNNIKSMYDAGTDVGRKDIKVKLWNLNRYVSSVKDNYDSQAFSVLKVNEYYNKNILFTWCDIFTFLYREITSRFHVMSVLALLYFIFRPELWKLFGKKIKCL